MTIFDKDTETTTVRITKENHTKLKFLYSLCGYEFLEDCVNEGLNSWIGYLKEELKEKKKIEKLLE